MPYVSDKQRRYFHAQRGKKVPSSVVDEFDAAEKAKNQEDGMANMGKVGAGVASEEKTAPSKTPQPGNVVPPAKAKKRKKGEVAAYLREKSKNKGMMAEQDPSGDEC